MNTNNHLEVYVYSVIAGIKNILPTFDEERKIKVIAVPEFLETLDPNSTIWVQKV